MSQECLINKNDYLDKEQDYKTIPKHEYKFLKVSWRKLLGVEPLLIFYGFASLMQTTVMQQFIYYRIGVIYNITHNDTLAYVCNSSTNSSSEKAKTDQLQEINSYYIMLISLGSSIASIITSPFYSVFSDRFGRRIMFVIPGTGIFVKSVLEFFAMYYNWPLYSFIYIECFYGFTGAYNFVICLAFSYVADRSLNNTRTLRMAFVGIMVATGAFIASLSSGIWIKSQGYIMPFFASTVVSFFCLFYPLVIMWEPKFIYDPEKHNLKPLMAVWEQIKSIVTVHKNQIKENTVWSVLILIIFGFYNIGEMSGVDLQTTYLMSYPICMTTEQLGFYGVLNIVAINLGAGLSSALLNRCLSDLVVILICLVFGMAYNLQMAFASSVIAAYIATGSNLLSFSAFPFFRGYLSKRTKKTEQGALFGGLVFIETVCGAVSKVLMAYFYHKTLTILHGMVFLFIGSFSLVAFILLMFLVIYSRYDDRKIKMKEEQ